MAELRIEFYSDPSADGGHEGLINSVRYISGLTMHCEHLIGGRYVSGTRSAVGRPYYQGGADPMGAGRLRGFCGYLPIEAFALESSGVSLHNGWSWAGQSCRDEVINGVPCLRGAVELSHGAMPVSLTVITVMDGTGFLERWLTVRNLSDGPLAISGVEPLRGLLWHLADRAEHGVDGTFTLTTLPHVQWGYEGCADARALTPGTHEIVSRRGRSGWGVPWFMARNEASGEVAVGHLEWSANWRMSFEHLSPIGQNDMALLFGIGPHARAPQLVIGPGGAAETPRAHLGLFAGGVAAAVQRTHDHVRNVSRKADEKNLLIGSARIVDGGLDWLEAEARLSAEQGMEYFMVDAGWYGNLKANWYESTGDWDVTRFGGTLARVREIIQGYGMKFVLWMEPESMGSGSELRKAHPDWAIRRDGAPADGEGRVLDLSRDEVAEFAEAAVMSVFAEHKVDGFKVDYNTASGEHGENVRFGLPESAAWRYVERLYAIFDRVAAEYPDAVLENCAGGGGRNDLGLFRRFHTSCISDYTILPRGIKQLNNLSMALPPERLRYYYRHYPGYHLYGGLETQLNVLMLCNPLFVGFGRDEGWLNADEAALVKRYVDRYKLFFRPVQIGCDVHHHTPALASGNAEPWCALEYSEKGKRRGYAGVFRFLKGEGTYPLRLRGMDKSLTYRVGFMSTGESFEAGGGALFTDGLPIRLDGALSSELITYEAV
ncbi:MAG: alpha-galactosidase [Oscillospiraceae bacterium]|nr:alpha-galactosidase [Oscillospiraceae bacterium]